MGHIDQIGLIFLEKQVSGESVVSEFRLIQPRQINYGLLGIHSCGVPDFRGGDDEVIGQSCEFVQTKPVIAEANPVVGEDIKTRMRSFGETRANIPGYLNISRNEETQQEKRDQQPGRFRKASKWLPGKLLDDSDSTLNRKENDGRKRRIISDENNAESAEQKKDNKR